MSLATKESTTTSECLHCDFRWWPFDIVVHIFASLRRNSLETFSNIWRYDEGSRGETKLWLEKISFANNSIEIFKVGINSRSTTREQKLRDRESSAGNEPIKGVERSNWSINGSRSAMLRNHDFISSCLKAIFSFCRPRKSNKASSKGTKWISVSVN